MFFLTIVTESEAQRRSSKRRSSDRTEKRSRDESRTSRDGDTETLGLADRLYYEIPLGNIGFSNGFNISLKPSVGYKFTERLSAGLGIRTFYQFVNRPAGFDDESFLFYGPAVFGRFKITEEIYIQGEYDYNSYASSNVDRFWQGSPLVGLGYTSGYGPWKFGIQVLFITDDDVRNIEGNTIDYWFTFSHNF